MYGYMGTQVATTIDNDDNDDDDDNLDGPALPVCVQLHWCENLHICIECQAGIYEHVDTYLGIEE